MSAAGCSGSGAAPRRWRSLGLASFGFVGLALAGPACAGLPAFVGFALAEPAFAGLPAFDLPMAVGGRGTDGRLQKARSYTSTDTHIVWEGEQGRVQVHHKITVLSRVLHQFDYIARQAICWRGSASIGMLRHGSAMRLVSRTAGGRCSRLGRCSSCGAMRGMAGVWTDKMKSGQCRVSKVHWKLDQARLRR